MNLKMRNTILARPPVSSTENHDSGAGVLPSISVVLPNYNHGKWLGRALTALLGQNVASMEIVLIDDGSTDNSADIIADFCKRDGRIKLIQHDVNRGPYEAVRSGIARARGELLLLAAADDFILPGLLSRAEQALNDHPEAAFFCSNVVLLDRDGRMAGRRPVICPRLISGYMTPDDVRREIRRSDNWFIGPSVVYRRGLLAKLGYFDASLGTLCDGLAQRLLAFRHGFYFDTEVLAVWMVDPTSLSSQTSLSEKESRRVIEIARHWISDHFPADVRDSYRDIFGRRLSFNMARQCLIMTDPQLGVEIICAILGWKGLTQSMARSIARVPRIGPTLLLAFITLRIRPMSLVALFGSWLRERVSNPTDRTLLNDKLPQAFKQGLA